MHKIAFTQDLLREIVLKAKVKIKAIPQGEKILKIKVYSIYLLLLLHVHHYLQRQSIMLQC
jgi:hypothetical protein